MPKSKAIRLNLGCGSNKIRNFINIDIEESCKPDLIHDFVHKKLPYKDNSVSEVVLSHVIEHISRRFHKGFLREVHRVLKPGGVFFVAYPEFTECYKNWAHNYRGMKEFWEATMFGRQLYPSDYHVCPMHTPDFLDVLRDLGFNDVLVQQEPTPNEHNTMIRCQKTDKPLDYEELHRRNAGKNKVIHTRN
jgi:predicted SAM-dependent methyltransferase